MSHLIDTTEMYLKTIYELEEDGVAPLRARIVERLGHSGPTVSQTVSRIERDGFLRVGRDRRILLTDQGVRTATAVVRKHRLAECLLLRVLGLPLEQVNEEACRWEHVMSDEVTARVAEMLSEPQWDPFGNPIPGSGVIAREDELSAADAVDDYGRLVGVTVARIGEPLQAEMELLRPLLALGALDGAKLDLNPEGQDVRVGNENENFLIPGNLARHLFVVLGD